MDREKIFLNYYDRLSTVQNELRVFEEKYNLHPDYFNRGNVHLLSMKYLQNKLNKFCGLLVLIPIINIVYLGLNYASMWDIAVTIILTWLFALLIFTLIAVYSKGEMSSKWIRHSTKKDKKIREIYLVEKKEFLTDRKNLRNLKIEEEKLRKFIYKTRNKIDKEKLSNYYIEGLINGKIKDESDLLISNFRTYFTKKDYQKLAKIHENNQEKRYHELKKEENKNVR